MFGDEGGLGSSTGARPSGGRRCTMRVLRDSGGMMVVVYEADPAAPAAPRTLVFESVRGRTRLEHYPTDWRRLNDRELIQLSRGG